MQLGKGVGEEGWVGGAKVEAQDGMVVGFEGKKMVMEVVSLMC